MLAIDTNVILRFMTRDDPGQAERARRLIETEGVFVTVTVLLETEWVLRSAYGYAASQRSGALRAFAGLPNVVLEDAALASAALALLDHGLDFADALHLVRSTACEAMITFDQRFARSAGQFSPIPVRMP